MTALSCLVLASSVVVAMSSATRRRESRRGTSTRRRTKSPPCSILFRAFFPLRRAGPPTPPSRNALAPQTLLGYQNHKPIRIHFPPFSPVSERRIQLRTREQSKVGKCNQFQISTFARKKCKLLFLPNASTSSPRRPGEDVATAGSTEWGWRRRISEFE